MHDPTEAAASDERDAREALCAVMRRMVQSGLNVGTAGNAAVRLGERLLLTPSGVPAEQLSPERLVLVDARGAVLAGRRPSSEWRLHVDLLAARPEAGAVVHCHSPYATAIACTRRDIPAFHYMVGVVGGDSVRCAPYATFGTQALSDHAVRALEGRRACLLANHGQVALGPDIERAFAMACEVENLARQYLLALAVGGPVLLDATQMYDALERFADYGEEGALRAAARPSPEKGST